jgi:Cu/Ag efflux pump CusA
VNVAIDAESVAHALRQGSSVALLTWHVAMLHVGPRAKGPASTQSPERAAQLALVRSLRERRSRAVLHAAAQRTQTCQETLPQDLPAAVATVEDLINKGIYLSGPKVGKLLLGTIARQA